MTSTIKVVVTMDVEPTTATTHPTATGPAEWGLGERAVCGYADIAGELGFPVTYFVHPEAAVAQADVFDRLRSEGACLGLHMHAWKYSMWRHGGGRYMAHYGGLSESEQQAILAESGALWHTALGEWPRYFRPGTFSANDAIFRVLADMGFRGGSCSVPGRMMPEMQAVWVGAEPDPHRTHPEFRMIAGEMDFVNMPMAVDFSIALEGRKGRKLHPDLRPDTDWMGQYGLTYDTIAKNIVSQVVARAPAVPVINIVSHNHFDYRDPNAPATRRLRDSLRALSSAASEANVQLVGATLEEVVDDVLALPPRVDPFVCEGNIIDKTEPTAVA